MDLNADMTMDEARELVADAALWPRVRDFLWDFAGQVHHSWIESLQPDVSGLMSSARVRRFVLDSLGVAPCFHLFPKDDYSRLLLLDGAALEAVVKWLGALACADELRRVTDGRTVGELRAALPGVYPELFGYTAYFSRLDLRLGGSAAGTEDASDDASRPPIAVKVVSAGLELLRSSLSGLPAHLLSRLKFKLPRAFDAECSAARIPQDGRAALDARRESARAAVARLLRLKFPEAYTLCC